MDLSTARVFVRDLSEASTFYRTQLGLDLVAGSAQAGYCVFQAGPVQLVVESVAVDAPPDDQLLVGRFTGLSFTVADVHDKHRELVARGVGFSGRPEQQAWGGVLATLRDPAGNELQIVQQPTA